MSDRVDFVNKDLVIEEGLLDIFEGNHLLFNLAALNTGIDYSQGRNQIMFENNMLLQMVPLRVAAKTSSIKRFIQISSASVYSKKAIEQQVPTPEDADTSNPEPSKIGYALAKKMGENLARWYAENSHLESVIVRFNNLYGEMDNFDELAHFIPSMIRKFLEFKEEVVVFGGGNQKRSFLYIDDAVDALLLLSKKGKNGEVYNVGGDEENSVKEVVNLIQERLNKKTKVIFDKSKPEGVTRRLLDNTKLKELSWKPKISFEEGLEITIKDISRRASLE